MPNPFNPNDPIPNDPFYYERTAAIAGPQGPIEVGAGLEVTPGGEMIAVGGGPAVTYLTAGPGIYVNANTGSVRIVNTGVLNLAAGNGIGLVRDTNNGTWTITNTAPAYNAGGTVTSVDTGDGLIGGPITTSGTIALSNTGVGAGTYQNATITVDAKGRITAASPGTVVSTISGTAPIVVTPGANAIISINEGSPLVPGALRICDSVSLSCSSVAASSTAVKNAYDLGAAALPCSVLTAQGDLISATAPGVPVRVPVGADGTILKACSACSSTGGLTWDTIALCNGTVTSVTAGTGLTGGTITESGTIALDTACVIAPTILPSQGSLLTATGPSTPVALGVGSNGQVLTANNLCTTGLEWTTPVPAVPCSAFNVRGDILVGTSPATFTALPVGVNGSVLVACSACTSGLTWVPAQPVLLSSDIIGKGALITGYGAGVPGGLAAGADGYILSSNSSCSLGLEWIANPGGTLTGITVSAPLSVNNTNPAVPALSIQAASTTQAGVVQLNDTINSTSSVEAATANTVNMAYNLASSASATAATGVANAALAQADATQALADAAGAQSTADQATLDAAAAQSDATQALADAAAAQADATSAQGTADQAVLDAAAAQVDATQALSDAANAQGDATQALTDASTAQSTANQALLDAGSAQDSADLAGLAAQAAQADATQALSNAAAAQATANAALPLSGGTLTGPVTFAAGQTIPTSSIQAASTSQAGVVQLNDTVTSTSTTQALTANQGKNLQDQINALAVGSNLTLAGTLDASTGNLATVTTEGAATGFAVGSPLPSAAAGNDNFFVIATVASFSYTPPGGVSTQVHVGDWFLSNGSAWEFLDVGFQAAYASTTAAGIVELATDIETQDGQDANVVVSPYALQSKVSDSTSTTSSTTIASSTAVKSAYDLASSAVPNSAITAKGDLIAGTGSSTYSALNVGTDGQILLACSSCSSGLTWGPAPSGASPATPTVAGVLPGYSCGVDGNISVGYGSLTAVDPANGGCKNVVLGVDSLCALTFGGGNVAIGHQTLITATNAGSNIAIGNCALRNTTFSNNIAIGVAAGCCLTTGTANVAIGSGTMRFATTASLNMAIGCRSMACATGCQNIGIGMATLCKVTGDFNVAVGGSAGQNITSGTGNTFLGALTGGFTNTGSCNVFIGFSANPLANTDCCLWVGVDTAITWLSGNSTSAIKPGAGIIDCANSCGTAGQVLMSNGANAICWGTVASTCSATPTTSGTVLGCTATGLTSLGACALLGITSGTNNVSIGSSALRCTTTGYSNTAVGNVSLCSNVTGFSNTAVGHNSLVVNTASQNTAVGASSLPANTSGVSNTAVGFGSLFVNTTGIVNTAIGVYAGCNITTGGCNVAIGCGVTVASGTASCQLAIGFASGQNWLTGTGSKAIRPGAGIIDCAGSCGTDGQVLMSNGANAICWGNVTSCSGTVTSITAGTGLTGGAITTSGTIALDTACVIVPSTLTAKGDIITATAASTPTALGVGTNGQVLTANSACASGLTWATPQSSPFITYTTSNISYTNGTPILVAVWGGGAMQGTVSLDLVGYGGFVPYWDFYLTGDATNGPSGWVQTSFYPPTSDGRSQGTWYVDYPVYPSPNNGQWEIYFSPTADALNPSPFTFFYRLLSGSNPVWQI